MKSERIPNDLAKHVKLYIFKKIALFVFLETILTTILVLWGDVLLGSATGTVLFILCASYC